MSQPPDNPSTRSTLLRNRNFVLLWCAYGISAMGDHLSEMALLKTQDAASSGVDVTPLMARITFLFFVPFFLLAPISGAMADRFSRRGLMVTADLARVLIMLSFGGLIALASDWGPWGVFSPVLLLGALAVVFAPARSALLPTIIRPDQLVRANAMLSGLGVIATMIAGVAGGYLAQHYAPDIAFKANAATFFASAVFLLAMRLPRALVQERKERREHNVGLHELREGVRYALAHRHVLELQAVAGLVWFCGPLVLTVIPAVVRDVYGGGYQGMSTFRALFGFGFILGAITLTILGAALRSEVAISWGLVGVALGIGIFALSAFLPAAPATLAFIGGAGVILAGLCGVSVMASLDSLLQRTVADRFMGRIYGLNNLITTGASLLATGLLGIPHWTRLDQWVGWILLAVSLLALAAGIITLIVRLRRGVHGAAMLFAEHLTEFIVKWWYRFQRIGPSRLPHNGPVVIASNHIGGADPMLIGAASPHRPMTFMIAAEYAEWPIVRRIVKFLECIPVRRGTRETSATKHALRLLREGKAMAIFIEGGIVGPGEPIRLKDGAASLALKTGAAVIPTYISGINYHDNLLRSLFARHNARLRMGPPVDLSAFREEPQTRDKVRAATRKIYDAILDLAPPDERAERLTRLRQRGDSDDHDDTESLVVAAPGATESSVPRVSTSERGLGGADQPVPRAEASGLSPAASETTPPISTGERRP